MPLLYDVNQTSFQYTLGSQKVDALREVSLKIEEGAFVCLSGPSGSGKSTLLNLLGLIESVQNGSIRFLGRELKKMGEPEKNRIRRFEIGFIFQNFNLFPVLTAQENVEYFLSRQGVSRSERKKRVRQALEAVGLWNHRLKKPFEMSGGQRQRVAIARAIAKTPKVIIADEPTASLDQKTGQEIMNLFLQANRENGASLVLSSHDPMVQEFCPIHIRLRDGMLMEVPHHDS